MVTGLGAVSGFGWGVEALRAGLGSGETAVRAPRRLAVDGHRTGLASEVPEDSESARFVPDTALSRADRYALFAAREAIGRAGLCEPSPIPRSRMGVFFGGCTAGMAEAEEFFARLIGAAAGRPRLRSLMSHQLDGPGNAVARDLGVEGPVETVSSACASGGLAIQAAFESIRRGEVDFAVAGGADVLCQLTYAGFNALRAVDSGPSRPFRRERAGLSLGEGAGAVVLESAESARARGATVLAVVVGAGASCDAHHMTAPQPEGVGAAAAVVAALEESDLDPGAVSLVNAHGTGTPLNDSSEANALRAALGGSREGSVEAPVTSSKGAIGHLLGSAGAIEAVATVLAIADRTLQPTAGGGPADPELGVDVVIGSPRPLPAQGPLVGLSTSFAFGGSNVAVLIGSPDGGESADGGEE
ncbi:MAG TPA: beta-ketoacyl-[acyl-carrier-protein] synthase family protein [Thermoanaerobaculia bacterium]|nr:beta-ketoacyl-[acyl-carrier-protein] synthase family protein [Thermoanaerobaculia bacterium]